MRQEERGRTDVGAQCLVGGLLRTCPAPRPRRQNPHIRASALTLRSTSALSHGAQHADSHTGVSTLTWRRVS
eukprot:1789522-Rhodomonas_salina.1